MANQLRMVLRTYTTRWETWMNFGLWLMWFVMSVLLSYGAGSPLFLTSLVLSSVYLGASVGTHVRFQFASPRARLIPGFASAHLLVAGAILAFAVTLQFCLLSTPGHFSHGTIACLLLVSLAATVWGERGTFLLLPLVVPLVAVSEFFPVAGTRVQEYLQGAPAVQLAIVVLALGVIAARAVRLSRLHEEMPEYARAWRMFIPRNTTQERRQRETLAGRARLRNAWKDGQFAVLAPRGAASSRGQRLVLHQLAEGWGVALAAPLLLGLTWAVCGWLFARNWTLDPWATNQLCGFLFIALSILAFAAGGIWERDWPHLAREALYPLDRSTWIGDLLGHGLLRTAVATLTYAAAVLAIALFAYRQGPWFSFALPYLVLAPCAAAALASVSFWVSSFHQPTTLLDYLVTGIVAFVWLALSMTIDQWARTSWALGGACGVCLLVAGLFGSRGFRRWGQVELG